MKTPTRSALLVFMRLLCLLVVVSNNIHSAAAEINHNLKEGPRADMEAELYNDIGGGSNDRDSAAVGTAVDDAVFNDMLEIALVDELDNASGAEDTDALGNKLGGVDGVGDVLGGDLSNLLGDALVNMLGDAPGKVIVNINFIYVGYNSGKIDLDIEVDVDGDFDGDEIGYGVGDALNNRLGNALGTVNINVIYSVYNSGYIYATIAGDGVGYADNSSCHKRYYNSNGHLRHVVTSCRSSCYENYFDRYGRHMRRYIKGCRPHGSSGGGGGGGRYYNSGGH